MVFPQGSAFPGEAGQPSAAPDPALGVWLKERGVALVGITYTGGWLLAEAPAATKSAMDAFTRQFGRASQVIISGGSINGMVSGALAEQSPTLFTAALPYCPALLPMTDFLGLELDGAFAYTTLVAPDAGIRVDGSGNVQNSVDAIKRTVPQAQSTATGRARLGLVSALMNFSGWVAPQTSEPSDADTIERGQVTALAGLFEGFFALRAHLASAAHGQPVGNEGVDYATQLNRSRYRSEVQTLYQEGHLDLSRDLATLATAARVHADPQAFRYLAANPRISGRIQVPLLALESSGDDWLVEGVGEYANRVTQSKASSYLRQAWVNRPGHCPFSRIELATAFDVLFERVASGKWPDTSPAALTARADRLVNAYPELARDQGTPMTRFESYTPGPFPRG